MTISYRRGMPIIEGIGRIVRGIFFVVALIGVLAVPMSLSWPLGDTRVVDLTLNMIIGQATKAALCLALVTVCFLWAFASGPRNYRAWGWVGIVSAAAAIAAVATQK